MNGLRKRLNICGTLYPLGVGRQGHTNEKRIHWWVTGTILEGICHTAVGGKQEPRDESVMREKTNEVKAEAWDGHPGCQDRTGGRMMMGRRGPQDLFSSLWWELGYNRQEPGRPERQERCFDFLANCVTQHNYRDCTIIFLFDSDLPSMGSLWKTWLPAGKFWGSDCVHRVLT